MKNLWTNNLSANKWQITRTGMDQNKLAALTFPLPPPQARIQRANVPSKQVLFNTKQPPAAAAGEHVDERKPENSKEKSKID